MTLRDRLVCALKGEMPDRIPFSTYPSEMPDGAAGERLRALGLTVISRLPPYRVTRPDVEVTQEPITDSKYPGHFTTYRTPLGSLTQTAYREPGYGSQWIREYLIKRPEDYAAMEFVIRDEVIEPDIDGFVQQDAALGDQGLAVPRAADPPAQELWRRYSGLERFALDWHDCQAEVRRVLDALDERNRTIWRIVANTPSDFCASGGNISGDAIGPTLFDELILPHFLAESEVMRPGGKRTLNHMDGMLRSLLGSVADCPVDIIEAFNPAPDSSVSVGDALSAWPDKALSINFPSSVHVRSDDEIRRATIDLLRQADPGRGFVIGITENVPSDVIVQSLTAIAETIDEHGHCPIDQDRLLLART